MTWSPSGQDRTKRIVIHVNDWEKEALACIADAAGYGSIARYMREVALVEGSQRYKVMGLCKVCVGRKSLLIACQDIVPARACGRCLTCVERMETEGRTH